MARPKKTIDDIEAVLFKAVADRGGTGDLGASSDMRALLEQFDSRELAKALQRHGITLDYYVEKLKALIDAGDISAMKYLREMATSSAAAEAKVLEAFEIYDNGAVAPVKPRMVEDPFELKVRRG